ncbi:undecaprenyldiphospho-muramoylpentapeptide beta-N-acetylglucosaminyltransferase [bacterium]|nr:undecaprenyldiphospho-muramoylpentapeptide beta-N-acetylglucosaminyltransferase [bacterium]
MRVLLTGGGTGGHLYPGLAVADILAADRGSRLLFVGTAAGLEATVVPGRGIDFRTVWISGLHRGRLLANLLFPLKMAVSFLQARAIVRAYDPDVVIGTGGYVTWPVIRAALFLHKRTFLLEQNRAPGLVTKQLAGRVDRVFLSFESTREWFPRQDNLRVTGNPVRADVTAAKKEDGITFFNLKKEPPVLLVFGGSQGARDMNRILVPVARRLLAGNHCQVVWAAGRRWHVEIAEAMQGTGSGCTVLPYIDRMDLAYAAADLVICRAGATTIAEVTCAGKPAVCIPFPGAADNHQEKNAQLLAEEGAALMFREREIDTETLYQAVSGLLQDGERRKEMARKAGKLARPDAAGKIAAEIQSLYRRGNNGNE